MKQLNEVARMQQLAGIITEIKINPIKRGTIEDWMNIIWNSQNHKETIQGWFTADASSHFEEIIFQSYSEEEDIKNYYRINKKYVKSLVIIKRDEDPLKLFGGFNESNKVFGGSFTNIKYPSPSIIYGVIGVITKSGLYGDYPSNTKLYINDYDIPDQEDDDDPEGTY